MQMPSLQPIGPPPGVAPVVGPPIQQGPPSFVTGAPQAVAPQAQGNQPPTPGPDGKPVKTRKPRAPRAKYREENAPKLTAVPGDYNPRKHLPLSKADFQDEALFYDWKASQAEKQLAKYREAAADIRTGGDSETRKNKKRLEKYLTGLAEMQKQLEATLGPEAFAAMVAKMQQQAAQASQSGQAAPSL